MIHLPKSQPAPECLESEKRRTDGDYKCGEVLIRLKDDFKNKCYICEEAEPTTINVEHFVAHRGDIEKKFDWNNLFFSCGHCNNTKQTKEIFYNILNCTVESDGVDTNITYRLDQENWESVSVILLANNDTVRTANTVEFLNRIYNGITETKKIESSNLRQKLIREIKKFENYLIEYDQNVEDRDKDEIKNKIIRHLRPTSNFTAFKRWIVRENPVFMEEFGAYL